MDVTIVEHGAVRVAWAAGADAGTQVLRALLADAGTPADEITHACPTCGSTEHGPLRTSSGNAVVNLSHSSALTVAVLALADAAASVGVDVEADRGPAPMTDLAALFAPHEPPTIREWTMIEAVVKADGRGLRIAPASVELTGTPGRSLPGSRIAVVPDRVGIEVAPVAAPAGYVISVAIDPARPSHRGRGSAR